MKYAVEMGSGAMIYMPSFLQTDSGVQKLVEGDTQTERWSHKPTFNLPKYGKQAKHNLIMLIRIS
jgi:hypothetical protein